MEKIKKALKEALIRFSLRVLENEFDICLDENGKEIGEKKC